MSKVVVISGHPNLDESWTNKVILEKLEQNIESIDIRRLDSLYPDSKIDVEVEQKALLDAEIVIFQYPFYWYNVPGLLKMWFDKVFTFNFAFGPEGDKLKNKHFILSFTIGGPEESYDPLGYNHFTIEQLVTPLQQTAYLASMIYQPPVYTYRMVYIPGVYNTQQEVEARATEHAERLLTQIDVLTNRVQAKFEIFVREWFGNFDQLPQDNSYFTNYLAPELKLQDAQGSYDGIDGFNRWYASLLEMFKPSVNHLLEQITLTPAEDGMFDAQLRVRVRGELTNGTSINQLINEDWKVSMDEEGNFIIHSYVATAV